MLYNGNSDFYPTPAHLARKMLDKVKFEEVTTILEPSAGKGDLIEMVKQKEDGLYGYKFDIDAIEKDANLRHILNGKEYRTVHDDFLTYETFKQYDLIIMNPPFSSGLTDAVDLKQSLEFAEQYGETKNIQLKYFTVTFYKKGTCHIVFNNDELLKKFNIFGSQKKGWLPPSYGKKQYKDMTTLMLENKAV